MIKVVDYIKTNGLQSLIDSYSIKATRHARYPNLILLKYHQINSPLSSKTVQQCRGIILDEEDSWNIVSFPYTKFFNYGEGQASTINWKDAKVYEKLDGSICTLYYYEGHWHVATSGMPDASGTVDHVINITYNDLFWRVWHELGYSLPLDATHCYMFELTTPYNKVIVHHKDNNLVLHGARCLKTLQEKLPEEIAKCNGWKCVRSFDLNSINLVVKACEELNPVEHEGYVVVDNNFHRIKVKSPQYVALSHIKGEGFTIRRLLEIIRTNESDEFLNYFPEYADRYHDVKNKFDKLILDGELVYKKYKDISNQKEFALAVKQNPLSFAMFAVRGKKVVSLKQAVINCNIKKLEELVT